MAEKGPIYRSIQSKISASLIPAHLEIIDDSSKHAGHAAMKGLNPKETHFRVTIVSEKFQGLALIKRHRMVNSLLDEELKNGLHALQLFTKTPEELSK